MKKYLILAAILALFVGCSRDNTVVMVGDKEGVVNRDGEILVKPIYKKVHLENVDGQKYAIVKDGADKYGIVNLDGDLKLDIKYDSVEQFINGFAKIKLDGKYGLINRDFKVVLEPVYEDIRTAIDDRIIAKKEGKYGCYDASMNLVAPFVYNMIYLSVENRMRVEQDGLWGFMDTSCKITVKPKYSFEKDYSKGLAKVRGENGLITFIDLSGKEVERKTFNEGLDF